MKHLFYLAAFAAMCAACSNNEIMDTAPPPTMKAIEMNGSFINNPTRGALTTPTLTKFAVWAWQKDNENNSHQVFDGAIVRLINDNWIYDNVRYWIPSRTYRFFALASSQNDAPTLAFKSPKEVSAWNNISFTYMMNETRPFDDDLVYATQTATTPRTLPDVMNPVALTFNHVLSQLAFSIIDDTPSGHSIKVISVSYKGAKQGTCTLGNVQDGAAPAVSWSIPTAQLTASLNGAPYDDAIWSTRANDPLFVIPANDPNVIPSNGTLSLTAQLYDVDNPDYQPDPKNPINYVPVTEKNLSGTISWNFVPGGSYHVILRIGLEAMTSNKPITFTVTQLNPFGSDNDIEITSQ